MAVPMEWEYCIRKLLNNGEYIEKYIEKYIKDKIEILKNRIFNTCVPYHGTLYY